MHPRLPFLIATLACTLAPRASAAFTTVINAPPASLAGVDHIGSNTQLNLHAGANTEGDLNINDETIDYFGGFAELPFIIIDVGQNRVVEPNDPNFFVVSTNQRVLGWTVRSPQPADNVEINLLGGTINGSLDTRGPTGKNTNVTVNLASGQIDGHLLTGNASFTTLSGGQIAGHLAILDGSLALMSGTTIGGSVLVSRGSSLQMTGGEVAGRAQPDWIYSPNWSSPPIEFFSGGIRVTDGSTLSMAGGVVREGYGYGGLGVGGGSQAYLAGGRVEGHVGVGLNASLTIAGGSRGNLEVSSDSRVTFVGDNFQLDGVPLTFNWNTYSFPPVNLTENSLLTGTLADGTPLVVSYQGYGDYLVGATVRFETATVPAPIPGVFHATSDPDAAPLGIRTGQQLVVGPGAVVPANFVAGVGGRLTVNGGDVGDNFRAVGSQITLSAGSIGEEAKLYRGARLDMSSGHIGWNLTVGNGATLAVSGGLIESQLRFSDGSSTEISGGILAGFYADPGASLAIDGGEFRVNGVPVPAMPPGSPPQPINLPLHAIVSGTLTDGRAFAYYGDSFAPGTLSLRSTAIPAASPGVLAPGPNLKGVRTGQTLVVRDGDTVPDHTTAGWGSGARISGGAIGYDFKAAGALVNISGGQFSGAISALSGSIVNISGGEFVGGPSAYYGAIVNISGGELDYGASADGGTVNVRGGNLSGTTYVGGGGLLNVSGGDLANVYAYESTMSVTGGEIAGTVGAYKSNVAIAGGVVGDGLGVYASQVTLTGYDFRIDGIPVAFADYRSAADIHLEAGQVLSGVFKDRTPFAFSSDEHDVFLDGKLTVEQPYVFSPPTDSPGAVPLVDVFGQPVPPPRGLRPNQTLTLTPGLVAKNNFTAAWNSKLVVDGGAVGDNLEAVGADVTINSGTIGDGVDAFVGSTFHLRGGQVGTVEAHRGGVVDVTGGYVASLQLLPGSSAIIAGGEFGELKVGTGSMLDMRGGRVVSPDGVWPFNSSVVVQPGSEIHLFGTDFALDSVAIPGLEPGRTVSVEVDCDLPNRFEHGWLQATLLDGSPLVLHPDWDVWPRPGTKTTIMLTLSMVLTADFDASGIVDAADGARWRSSFGAAEHGMDGGDFLAWQRQLGRRLAGPTQFAVPEPATWTLAALGGMLLVRTCGQLSPRVGVDSRRESTT